MSSSDWQVMIKIIIFSRTVMIMMIPFFKVIMIIFKFGRNNRALKSLSFGSKVVLNQ